MADTRQRIVLETTASLLDRVRDGDARASDDLVQRYLPALQKWAHGRLPRRARDINDTDDLVQITLLKALESVRGFDPQHKGALFTIGDRFGDSMHFLGANLDFYGDTKGSKQIGMQGLITIILGQSDIILKPAGYRFIKIVHSA